MAFDADPSTGVYVDTTAPSTGVGTWEIVGGTSLGAPAWAGIMAIADQGRATAGLGSLDGATQTLPALYALPSSDFHKVGGPTTTGLGSPDGASLVDDLAFGATARSTSSTGGSPAPAADDHRKIAKNGAHMSPTDLRAQVLPRILRGRRLRLPLN